MPRDDTMYLGHMVEYAQTAQQLITGKTRDDLENEKWLQLALVRALQIVGEAALRVSDELQALHPEIPWRKMAAFRHILVHDYFDVNYDTVWHVATTQLQALIDQVGPILPQNPP